MPALAEHIASPICGADETLNLNSSHRVFDHTARTARCFELAVPATGILDLEVVAPRAEAAEPWIHGLECGAGAAEKPQTVLRLASRVMLDVEPGNHRFCVSPQSASHEVATYRLINRFLAVNPWGGIDFSEEDPEDPEETEIDPNASTTGPSSEGIGPIAAGDLTALLCGTGTSDDHGDSLLCATPLRPGQTAAGKLRNDWDDDHDVFVFELRSLAEITLELVGDRLLTAALYDRRGRRLAVTPATGAAVTRMSRVLPGGLYYLRLEGRGGYEVRLGVDESAW